MIQGSQLAFTETLCVALLAGAIWASYLYFIFRRIRLPEVMLRSLLLAIALVCLCLMIYQPQYRTSKPAGKALLLTQDIDVRTLPDSLPVFALPQVNAPAQVARVPDLAFIERNYPQTSQVYIAGYGLEPEQTKSLQRLQIRFLEQAPPQGFNWLSYSKLVTEGDVFTVSGTYLNTSPDSLKLRLSIAAGGQDSTIVSSGQNRFSLQVPVRIPQGNYTASLQVVAGDSLRTELLPYVVKSRQPLQVLMLLGFPSFEVNYLKDWLGQAAHQVQVRARISRDKYALQSYNREQKGAKQILAPENLAASDLLICDAESFRQLSATEKKRIQEALAQGLGLLVLTDEEWLKKPEILGHRFGIRPSRNLSFVPRLSEQAAQGKSMADKLAATFVTHPLLLPIAYSQAEEIITAYTPDGKGRVGAQLAAATFPWILQGQADAYSQFWTTIIEAISRRQPVRNIRLTPFPFIQKGYPSTFTITDTVLSPATIRYTSGHEQQVMPQQGLPGTLEIAYPFLPAEEGWIQIRYAADTAYSHQAYVLPPYAWQDLKQAGWWRQYLQVQASASPDKAYTYAAWERIPLLWFFLPLVASLGLLWWREKK